jgi:hypothetical protein
LQPGESSVVVTGFTMHQGMGGKHAFAIKVTSNDPARPELELMIYANFVPPGTITATPGPG